MSIRITINGQPIDFPSTSEQQDWSEAVITFAEVVEEALRAVVGTYDVPAQTFTIDAYNPGTDIDIPALSFPTDAVRGIFVQYMVHRETDSDEVNEVGELRALYNSTDNTWDLSRDYADDAQITFSISSAGQVSFSSTAIAGSNHQGFITFKAQTLENEA